jgi:hypothetical protein
MVTEKLIINEVDIPLVKGLGTVLTYSIKDIEQPDKRKASFSKTINLPHSKVTSELFNFIFEINSDSTFNPNLKADAIYLIDDIAVFKGIIQLKKVNKLDNEHYTYDVVLLGELANIFTEIGDGYIDDADMNWVELNHPYNAVNVFNSWDTSYILNGVVTPFSYGSGYTYPMINYSGSADQTTWKLEDFFPTAYAKEYIDRIFDSVNFEYESNFFNSDYFKRLIIPFTGKELTRSNLDYEQAYVQGDTPVFDSTGVDTITTSVVGNETVTNGGVYDVVRFTNLTDNPLSQYDPLTGIYTPDAGLGGIYSIIAYMGFTVELDPDTVNNADMISTFVIDIVMENNGVVIDQFKIFVKKDTSISPSGYTTNISTPYENPDYKNQIVNLSQLPDSQYSSTNNPPSSGYAVIQSTILPTDEVVFKAKGYFVPDASATLNFKDIITGVEKNGAATINMYFESSLQIALQTTNFALDNTISFESAIPKKIKKRDFFKALIEMFNLYIEPDKDNPNKLYIEPRDDFYNTDVNDWSSKLDISKDIKYDTLASLNKSRYNYSYKKDVDYYNKLYQDTWARTYGNREIDIENDFNSGEYSQEVMFSPTPSVGTVNHNRIIPIIIGVDENLQPKTTNSNIRILYYDGLKDSNEVWTFRVGVAPTSWVNYSLTKYPYCGHFNDPYNPTEDINFGLTKEIYWDNTFETITVTNNNLYNKYHRTELEEQTNKDSKMVTAWFLLTPADIYNLDFKSQYFFDNAYFRLQEVKYKPNSYEVSECKFLKLNISAPFVPTTNVIVGGYDDEIGEENNPVIRSAVMSGDNTVSLRSGTLIGRDNYVAPSVTKFDIQGDENRVMSKSENITIKGDNNVIESNLENITLINTSNVTVTESNVTYINGQKKGGDGILLVTSGTYSQDLSIVGYEADCTSGIVTINLLDGLHEGYEQTFKKIAGDNDLVIDARFINGQVESDASIRITKINDSVTLYYNGVDYNIK